MDIKVTSSGRIFYQVDSTVAAILCEALPSVFEKVAAKSFTVEPLAPTMTPKWVVNQNVFSKDFFIQLTIGSRIEQGAGPGVAEHFTRMGYPVPPKILADYRLAAARAPEPRVSNPNNPFGSL